MRYFHYVFSMILYPFIILFIIAMHRSSQGQGKKITFPYKTTWIINPVYQGPNRSVQYITPSFQALAALLNIHCGEPVNNVVHLYPENHSYCEQHHSVGDLMMQPYSFITKSLSMQLMSNKVLCTFPTQHTTPGNLLFPFLLIGYALLLYSPDKIAYLLTPVSAIPSLLGNLHFFESLSFKAHFISHVTSYKEITLCIFLYLKKCSMGL